MGTPEEQPPVWPDAPALPCPRCGDTLPLCGVTSDLRLMFECCDDGWCCADSWTTVPGAADPCVVSPFSAKPGSQRAFLVGALQVLFRVGAGDDHVFFHSPDADHSVHFTLVPGGDGELLAQVGGRYWTCTDCGKRPPPKPNEALLYELGFRPPDPQLDYACSDFPADPELLAGIAEIAFREALHEPDDFGLVALFNNPGLAEAFHLGWSWSDRR